MDLDSFISSNEESYEMWVEFRDFEIKIRYVDRTELQKIIKRSRMRNFDRRSHQAVEEVSDEKLCQNIAKLITDWRGFTLGKLAEMVPVKVTESEQDTKVPYSEKNAATLVREVYGLDNFLIDTITDIQTFREEKLETETKNSEASHGNISNLAEIRAENATVPSETA
jgi:hypothetical protein